MNCNTTHYRANSSSVPGDPTALFKGVAADIKLLGATYLPILQRRLPQIAAAFNEMGRSALFALTRPHTSDDLSIVLVNTAKLVHNARNAIGAFADGFVRLGAIGSTFLPQLGTAIDGVAQRFERWVTVAGSDGTIRKMIVDAIQGFKDLFAIVGNVGSALVSIFTGLAGPTGSVLASLRDTTAALADFLATASAQDALGALGQAFRDISDAVRGVLLEALKQLAPIIGELAPVVAAIAVSFGKDLVGALQIVGPILLNFAKFLNDNKEAVVVLADALLVLYGRFLLLQGITKIVAAFSALWTALSGISGAVAGIAAIGVAATVFDELQNKVTGAGLVIPSTLDNITGAVGELGNAFATLDFSGIGNDIAAEWQQLVDGITQGTSPVGELVQTLGQRISDFGTTTQQTFTQIGTFFAGLGSSIAQGATTFVQPFIDGFNSVVTFFAGLPGVISGFVGEIGTAIAAKATDIWNGFLGAVQSAFEPVKAFFSQTPFQMGEQIGAAIGDIITAGINLMTAFGTAISTGFQAVLAFFVAIPGQIAAALASLGTTIAQVATDAWNAFLNACLTAFAAVVAFFVGVPQQVHDAVAPLPGQVVGVATEAGTGFLNTVTNLFNQAVAFVSALPGRIGAFLSSIVGIAINAAQQAGSGFLNGITDFFNRAVAFVRGIPGAILSAIGNLGSLLVGAGQALMDGLLSGIKSAYQGVLDFVSGIAAGIAAHKGPLPFDKIVLKPNGLALMEGLLAGIKVGNAQVQAYASTIAGGIADAVAPGGLIASARLATASMTGANGANAAGVTTTSTPLPVTIPIHIGDEVVRVVRTEIDTSNRSVKRTVNAGAGVTAG